MNSEPERHGMESNTNDTPPSNWREALLSLVSSRIGLIRHESRHAAKLAARKTAMLAAMAACLFFAWALLLVGGIALLSDATGLKWPLLALAAAALHIIATVLLARSAKAPAAPVFPATLAEFQKDREWIENLQNNRKSDG